MAFLKGKPSSRSEGLSLWNQVFIPRRRKQPCSNLLEGWYPSGDERSPLSYKHQLELRAEDVLSHSLSPLGAFSTGVSCWGEASVCSHSSVWESASVSVDLLELAPIRTSSDCPVTSAKGFGISEGWRWLCSEQDDFISFPRSVPSYSPLSELWWTFFWPRDLVSLAFGIMCVLPNHIQIIKLTTSGPQSRCGNISKMTKRQEELQHWWSGDKWNNFKWMKTKLIFIQ